MIENVEVWKDIPNYEGSYQASNLGNIKSIYRKGFTKGKVLKQVIGSRGYKKVSLSNKQFEVHVLIAMTFKGFISTKGKTVDHKDNDRLNNREDNIQIISHRENISKDRKNGASKYVGVSNDRGRWRARIGINKKMVLLGYFDTELEAHKAYQNKLSELTNSKTMKRFNHKKIADKVCEKYNLTHYKKGKFIHFKNEAMEIGFIEQIGRTKNYLQTIFISFFDFDNKPLNDEIVNFITDEYKVQKSIIDGNVEGLNVCLEQRAYNVVKSTLI